MTEYNEDLDPIKKIEALQNSIMLLAQEANSVDNIKRSSSNEQEILEAVQRLQEIDEEIAVYRDQIKEIQF